MPCYGPLIGFYSKDVNPSGKRSVVFDIRKSHSGVRLQVPCGKCVGCVLERSRQWALRLAHEHKMHRDSAFVTLTYSDKFLPVGGTLDFRAFQLFMKRLRKVRAPGLRFFGCGEYGESTGRPHYHLLLLNTWFGDRLFYKKSRCGKYDLFRSVELDALWPFGENLIGDVTYESSAYVAGYVIKKFLPRPAAFYDAREPEFRVMSRRPGIGYPWFERFYEEAYRADSAIAKGREVGLPRYYDQKFKVLDDARFEKLRRARKAEAVLLRADNSSARLRVKEKVALLNACRFKRDAI